MYNTLILKNNLVIGSKTIPKGKGVHIVYRNKDNYKILYKDIVYDVKEGKFLSAMVNRKVKKRKSATKKAISIKSFVRKVVKDENQPFSKIRLVSYLECKKGRDYLLKEEIPEMKKEVNEFILARGSNENVKKCPSCGNTMDEILLADNRKAWNCSNDLVTLPF